MSDENVTQDSKQPKHHIILNALDEVDGAIIRFENFKDNVTGGGTDKEEKSKPGESKDLTLPSVLDLLPEILTQFKSRIDAIRNVLDEHLY